MPKTMQKLQPIAAPEPDKYETHAAVAASKLDLNNLDLEERAFLGTCQDIYRNSRGVGTPFENFVTTVIRWVTWGNPPTPDALIEEIKTELEEDFEMTLHSVKRFAQNYPDLLAEPQATPEPPVAEETSEPAAKHPAKAQRTRNRKAAAQ